jgi:hypothetical protein
MLARLLLEMVGTLRTATNRRHTPRKLGIQYAAAWITRFRGCVESN